MFPSFPAAAWLNAGWSPAGGWDGSSSMTGMIYLDLRYVLFLFILLCILLTETLIDHCYIYLMSSEDSTGSGETEPTYSWSLQHHPGSPGEHPQQHTSKLLQQNDQLSQGKREDDDIYLLYIYISSYCLFILLFHDVSSVLFSNISYLFYVLVF